MKTKTMLQKTMTVVLSALLLLSVLTFTSCKNELEKKGHTYNEGKNELEKEGYTYNEECNWYEKEGEKANEIYVNLTQSEEEIGSSYVVTPTVDHIVFVGSPYKVYKNFEIKVAGRATPVYIELDHFSYSAPAEKVALDASGVTASTNVFIIASGNCSITGGAGKQGQGGQGFDVRAGSKSARAGNDGESGTDGYAALLVNSCRLSIEESGVLMLTGGFGGNGGTGGAGEGSDADGKALSGKGGNGGTGGNGAAAIIVNKQLEVVNNGGLVIYGGSGGKGGDGADGGTATVRLQTDNPDHGGEGGKGGTGGNGAFAIAFKDGVEKQVKVSGLNAECSGGNGGNGGYGGNGGNSLKTTFSSAGNAGNSGNGGNGGNGSYAFEVPQNNDFFLCNNGIGGEGGNAGTPGNTQGGSGSRGSNGQKGLSPV